MQFEGLTVIGGGLAGCEAAWQAAQRGIKVRLYEMRPAKNTPAHHTGLLAELVCSNSLRGAALTNAVGLLKEEARRAGSLILRCADQSKVPAGGALAVDRERFAGAVERAIESHPRIRRVAAIVERIPDDRPVILATGPLTGDALAKELERACGGRLSYYDAIAPIVAADSLDRDVLFAASRWDKGGPADDAGPTQAGGDRAYLNAPMSREQYEAFVDAVLAAEKVEARAFEEVRYFEGCLPIEIMAERGRETLRHGPMKPVGLTDPRTGRWPYAVVQLRQEDEAASAYNLVGFQTRMTYGAQAKVFRLIPGLENVEIQRFGSVHRNTFVDAPAVLDGTMQLRARPGVCLAGQITGVEGYVESIASGLVAAVSAARRARGETPSPFPPESMTGALMAHITAPGSDPPQPMNANYGLLPDVPARRKKDRKERKAEIALAAARRFAESIPVVWRKERDGC